MVLELGFRINICIHQNFELILNILEYTKPSISSLKQPGRLAACLLKKTPMYNLHKYHVKESHSIMYALKPGSISLHIFTIHYEFPYMEATEPG